MPQKMPRYAFGQCPDKTVIIAVGDIHGQAAALKELLLRLKKTIQTYPDDYAIHIHFLGDYIDRGPDSCGVIDSLIAFKESYTNSNVDIKFHMGNHDAFALVSLDKMQCPREYLKYLWRLPEYGGDTTLKSYGITQPTDINDTKEWQNALDKWHACLKEKHPGHLTFLDNLIISDTIGGYFFCHAGIDPLQSLHRQEMPDLIGLRHKKSRKAFLCNKTARVRRAALSVLAPGCGDKMIIHGHSINLETPPNRKFKPDQRDNYRIGLDTGCYYEHGSVTAIVIEPGILNYRFISQPTGATLSRKQKPRGNTVQQNGPAA